MVCFLAYTIVVWPSSINYAILIARLSLVSWNQTLVQGKRVWWLAVHGVVMHMLECNKWPVYLKFILHGVHLPIISKGARCLMQCGIIAEACDYGNTEKLQSDWCRCVQPGTTTQYIASHRILSPHVRFWLHEIGLLSPSKELFPCYTIQIMNNSAPVNL